MKTPLLILLLITSLLTVQIQGQTRTIVNAMNSEISDNLDLRVVASLFGDSRNLEDFERRLNDPKLQISNLDLNNDGRVDFLRVIEAVEKRTHIIIIQSVLNRDLYQDVATIEVEKTWNNNVRIQVIGNSYFYGANYIYEPVYCYNPIIYTDFWMSNYRPYYSNWCWNYYPSYYFAWNTYPLFRYRYNVNICLNNYSYNNYNYVNHRRSSYSSTVYNNHRATGYERQYPNSSFSRRNTAVSNSYELDQVRNSRKSSFRDAIGYNQNRTENFRDNGTQRTDSRRDYSQNRVETPKESAPKRDYTDSRVEFSREPSAQRNYSQNRVETPRESAPKREYSQNRAETPRELTPQREYSQNRIEIPRKSAPQRVGSARENSSSSNSSSDANSSARSSGNRRI